jgi:heme oxygenase (biliverdin-IX-beta and delta-forming)
MNIQDRMSEILAAQEAFALATTNALGLAETSYCPFLFNNDHCYIFISELASHTQNLKINMNCASLTMSEATPNPFTRPRIALNHKATFVQREEHDWSNLMALFESKLGNTVAMLRSLPDFHLVKLQILGGTFIEGFGKAYQFEGCEFASAQLQSGR